MTAVPSPPTDDPVPDDPVPGDPVPGDLARGSTAAATATPTILVVDDLPVNRVLLRRVLSRLDAEIVEVGTGEEALAVAGARDLAVILLDVGLPDIDGFEVASRLAAAHGDLATPVIFVTASHDDDLNRLRGYALGAVDYIPKPINDVVLLSKVGVFLRLKAVQQQLAEQNRRLMVEVADRLQAEEAVRHQATHDVLTGLPNRLLFMDRLEGAIRRSRRSGIPVVLAYLDIDGFKPVNDTHGHVVGDRLLQAIAARTAGALRAQDTVARLGGDEFAIIAEGAGDGRHEAPEVVLHLCERIVAHLQEPFTVEGPDGPLVVRVGASMGLAAFPHDAGDADALVAAADDAMYRAKRAGGGRCALAG